MRRVSIFSNKTTHQIRLKIAGAELNISAEDIDYSNKAEERLTCSYQGDDMQIGFNSRFLVEMLNNLTFGRRRKCDHAGNARNVERLNKDVQLSS